MLPLVPLGLNATKFISRFKQIQLSKLRVYQHIYFYYPIFLLTNLTILTLRASYNTEAQQLQ